jgi:hypothetical protein
LFSLEAVVMVEWCLGDGISKHPSAREFDADRSKGIARAFFRKNFT